MNNVFRNINLCLLGNFTCFFFCRLLIFSKTTFSKNSFRNAIRVSKSLDPDQARCFVGPDLGPNCLQKLSADDTSRYSVSILASAFMAFWFWWRLTLDALITTAADDSFCAIFYHFLW